MRKGDERFLKYFDFSTILLETLTGHRFSFQHIKLKHVDWKTSFFPKIFIERFKQDPTADFLKYKGFISKILLWDANRTNVSFYFYSWKETICWMENIFWKFSIHKEIFALKADCVNFFKSIKLIGKYFVGLTWKKILWDNVPTIFM